MGGLTLGLVATLFPPVLALHLLSVMLCRALRTYSRSLLEELCEARGCPERADAIAHLGGHTERAAESLAVLTGLGLAAFLGALVTPRLPRLAEPVTAVEAAAVIALALGAVGYVAAGVFGRVYAERVLVGLWPLARPLRVLTWPLTAGSLAVEALAGRLSRRVDAAPRPASVEVEIHHTVEDPEEDLEADLPEVARDMLENVVALTRRDVSEIMTPRLKIVALPVTTTVGAALRTFRDSGRSRVPIFGASRDDIVGILYAKDLLSHLGESPQLDARLPRSLVRPALCVPETKAALDLLTELRERRTHIAMVLDEYGGVTGLVTLEDLLEELVGAIDDEHDVPTPEDPLLSLGGGRYEVDATLSLEELNDRLHLHLPTDEDFLTVGGLAFHALGRVPEPGASFRFEGMEFTIVQVVAHSIRRLRIDLHPEPVASESPAG